MKYFCNECYGNKNNEEGCFTNDKENFIPQNEEASWNCEPEWKEFSLEDQETQYTECFSCGNDTFKVYETNSIRHIVCAMCHLDQ